MYCLLALAILLVVVSLYKPIRNYARFAASALAIAFGFGFLLLCWFHFQIAASIELINPANQVTVGRFYIPVWIENEKLFFSTFILSLVVITAKHKTEVFRIGSYLTLSVLTTLTFVTSNPFFAPLPIFHARLTRYSTAITSGASMTVQIDAYQFLFRRMVTYYNNIYMWLHPPFMFIAYAIFVMAIVAIVLAIKDRKAGYEKLAHAYVKPAFILLTAGLMLGYPWAIETWQGIPWWYDTKVNISIVMWLLYGSYLHMRMYRHRRGMLTFANVLGIIAFLSVVITYLAAYFVPGVHVVATGM